MEEYDFKIYRLIYLIKYIKDCYADGFGCCLFHCLVYTISKIGFHSVLMAIIIGKIGIHPILQVNILVKWSFILYKVV